MSVGHHDEHREEQFSAEGRSSYELTLLWGKAFGRMGTLIDELVRDCLDDERFKDLPPQELANTIHRALVKNMMSPGVLAEYIAQSKAYREKTKGKTR